MSATERGFENLLAPPPPTREEDERHHAEMAEQQMRDNLTHIAALGRIIDRLVCEAAMSAGYGSAMERRLTGAWMKHGEAFFDAVRLPS